MSNLPTISTNNQPSATRLPVIDADLAKMIGIELSVLMDLSQDFTAYTVTMLLRQKYPGMEIEHDRVRDLVRTAMAQAPAWQNEYRDWLGTDALTWYLPTASIMNPLVGGLTIDVTATPAAPKQLPASFDNIDWDA